MTPRLNVLIPMAGKGTRFRKAGYDTYKPFLLIGGKPMIQYVLDAFPPEVTKRVLVDRSLLTDEQLEYLRRQPGVIVQFVPPHSLGPAYTIHAARAELPLDEAFFIAYCDIYWTWNWSEITGLLDHDGVVFTRRRFHPHLVGSNYSAFCRPAPDDPDRMLEIREKGSFTDDWMTEPLSVGCFYVRDGTAMMRAIDAMIASERKVSQEFFPSLLFNDLVAAGQRIRLHDVDFFVHWGVPAQLEDLLQWVRVFRRLATASGASGELNVCCMGGAGERMKRLGNVPKALMPVAGEMPMFRYVAERFGCAEDHFIVSAPLSASLADLGVPGAQVIDIGEPTRSQLETLKRAAGFLMRQREFFLTSCDAFGLWDPRSFRAFVEREAPDAVVFTFGDTVMRDTLGGNHTYVESSDDTVDAIHIKHRPNAEARGLAGFFWFRSGEVFGELDRIEPDPGRELCADHVIKYMVQQGRKVGAFPIADYVHLGSPTELKEFEFWSDFHTLFPEVA